jgi:hypothetical protein
MTKSGIIQYKISLMYYRDYTIYYIQDLDVQSLYPHIIHVH